MKRFEINVPNTKTEIQQAAHTLAMKVSLPVYFGIAAAGAVATTLTGAYYMLNSTEDAKRKAVATATYRAERANNIERKQCRRTAAEAIGTRLLDFPAADKNYLLEKGGSARSACDSAAQVKLKNTPITPDMPSPFWPLISFVFTTATGAGLIYGRKHKKSVPDGELRPM
ncbi:MAG: hypothetical protein V4621_07290 [Pseudomonadota bacterium]